MPADSAPLPRLDSAEWLKRQPTRAVFRALQAGGYPARAVGGVVRNALLGEPVADVDIATPARPEEVLRLAAAAGLKAIPTGLQHGTVTVVADHTPFEVTTLREDVETFGRHARVAFTDDWAADARRRDFTINALYCDADGNVYDPLGGYTDVLARRVRFIGNAEERIREDYLRILRFFRMTAVYAAGPPDAAGLAAAVRERAGLTKLSGERLHQELMRLLAAPRAPELTGTMRDYGLLTAVLPVAPRPAIMRRLAEIEQELGRPPDPVLRLAALAVEVIEDALRLRDRLRLSTAELETLARAAAAPQEGLNPGSGEREAKVRVYRYGAKIMREQLLLNWARSGASPADPAATALYALPARWQAPEFPLGGADIVAAGVPPGPRIGEILRALEDRWVADGFSEDRKRLDADLVRLLERE
ncbi:MAG: CCA tRNA nucleotidyltransferase [Hyphomicrobiaceae bacterium]|nr:CCA tRNA nucleotidyltransferase [Hyphomicrobiaceae bacterium]